MGGKPGFTIEFVGVGGEVVSVLLCNEPRRSCWRWLPPMGRSQL
ncbi:hypothetical protein LPU83_2817 [Rhizobium favelukesii]|uniref:Uncharacterized protein n=1 Tax=Rhizobium favelukesii TaxID=348824 RepID=W6RI81_9HYPH|nr:hypothetical protein LPU83_2817 [Rhizobium favelukesii]